MVLLVVGLLISVRWYVVAVVILIFVEFIEIIFIEFLFFLLRCIYLRSILYIFFIFASSKFILIVKRYSKSLIEYLVVYRDLFLEFKGVFSVCDWSGVEGN